MRWSPLLTMSALLALGCACNKSDSASAAAAKQERGAHPWVFRSVLDGQPRMLTVALRRDLWVAYDAQRGALARVWPDGVSLDGAVYNEHHGPQPFSLGKPTLVSRFAEPWHVLRGGRDVRPSVRYRGHRFREGHVVLASTLTLDDGAVIEIEERPEAISDGDAPPRLERSFRARGVPDGAKVVLDFNAPALASYEDIEIVERRDGVVGKLTLRADAPTRLTIQLPAPVPARAADADAVMDRGPAALMAESDCAACHNPTNTTVGPSWTEIAAFYRTTPSTIAGLARKIREGGSDDWGDAAMVAHPTMDEATAARIAEHILTAFDPGDQHGKEGTHRLAASKLEEGAEPDELAPGLDVLRYDVAHALSTIPLFAPDVTPSAIHRVATLSLDGARGDYGTLAPAAARVVRVRGVLAIERAGEYDLRIDHDGDAQLLLDGTALVRDLGGSARRMSPWVSAKLERGLHRFELLHGSSAPTPHVSLRWQPPGGAEALVPAANLRSVPRDPSSAEPGYKSYQLVAGAPGDHRPLDGVHPSFALSPARPHDFKPMVAGLDTLPDGRLVVSTWDARGSVYILSNLTSGDADKIEVRTFAEGLSEPLGLKVVDGSIYVLQKHELTKLVDRDGDGRADDYVTVSNGWAASGNFHEFAFGLGYRDGDFYATLATAVEPGGAATQPQLPDRGKVMRISRDTGAVTFIAHGLRTPNGIGTGTDGELFVTDNEGDWSPANKLLHVQPGAFYGSRIVDPSGTADLPVTPAAVYLPMDEAAYSPSQPIRLDAGPYQNQMLYGDVTYGGLGRISLQKVGGQYQGCVHPFTQGLETGINRIARAADGSMYVGGLGNPGNWNHHGKLWYGLERLRYTGAPTFEMLSVALRSDGLEITFTEPLRVGDGDAASDYALKQWHYVPTAAYGGPKVGEHALRVRSVHVAPDRRRVFLAVPGILPGHLVHVRMAQPAVAESGRDLWATETWCTVNRIPKDAPGDRFGTRGAPPPNTLSDAERAAGFRLLFDGKTTRGFRSYRGKGLDQRWRVRDGALTLSPGGGDIVSEQVFEDFELELEWQVAAGGNGGVFYRLTESAEAPWMSAPELQLLDDAVHPDSQVPAHRAGGVYDLVPPRLAVSAPAGRFNKTRVVARGAQVEHWLNGRLVAAYDADSEDFRARVARSKFAPFSDFARARRGAIGLQDHGDAVRFRSIKIRPL